MVRDEDDEATSTAGSQEGEDYEGGATEEGGDYGSSEDSDDNADPCTTEASSGKGTTKSSGSGRGKKVSSLSDIVKNKAKVPKKAGQSPKFKGKELDFVKPPKSWDWRDYGIVSEPKYQVPVLKAFNNF